MTQVCQGTVIGDVRKPHPVEVCPANQQHFAFQGQPVMMQTVSVPVQNQWSFELLGCFQQSDPCIEAFFCGPCQLTRQYNMLLNDTNEINWAALGGLYTLNLMARIPLASCFLTWHVRHSLRRKYNISGSVSNDAVVSLCCGPCAIAQQYRELSNRGEWSGACCAVAPRVAPTMDHEMGY